MKKGLHDLAAANARIAELEARIAELQPKAAVANALVLALGEAALERALAEEAWSAYRGKAGAACRKPDALKRRLEEADRAVLRAERALLVPANAESV